MIITEIIEKKKRAGILSRAEIDFVVDGYTFGNIPDYQMSALLMAVYFSGMNDDETWNLTQAMLNSGLKADLSGINGVTVDKHSTGGVGDKTTLIAAPIAAACGVKVPKLSGRGLGFTGGTVDKLESIPGYRTSMPVDEFISIVNTTGLSLLGLPEGFCPADKKIYALRDVTATVDSLPLIVSSIMSKKLSSNADCIVFDVKTGNGSFCNEFSAAFELAEKLIFDGEKAGKRVSAVITNMDEPLGCAIGNALEVKEAAEVLKGGGPEDLKEVSLVLASEMLFLAGLGTPEQCRKKAENALKSGAAFEKLKAVINAHGGNANVLTNAAGLPSSSVTKEIRALKSGFVKHIDAAELGRIALTLGAGRLKKDDTVDHGAGMLLHKKCGDFVERGEIAATLYSKEFAGMSGAANAFHSAVLVDSVKCGKQPVVLEILRGKTY